MASQWEVFHLIACRHAKPQPKNKFLLVAYTSPSPHGFFINSSINRFIRNRPHLLPCEAEIFAHEHHFLNHDSFVDCRDIFDLRLQELTSSRGHLSPRGTHAVIAAVRACPVLERFHKQRILI